ncbi:MAG: TIGR02300 family protein [Xanthobacteraceae bacterium]|nr:TIGR02300 family protein [Xanthobacteraceae bacterium]
MAKPELGTKRVCQSCGAKFYDLSKDPIACPKCGAIYEVVMPVTRGGRPAAAAAAAAAATAAGAAKTEEADARDDGAEVISLEDADAEATGSKSKKGAGDPELESEDDVEVEGGDDEEDNTFLVTDEEEEGGDVSDIIGDGIDKEEEN